MNFKKYAEYSDSMNFLINFLFIFHFYSTVSSLHLLLIMVSNSIHHQHPLLLFLPFITEHF